MEPVPASKHSIFPKCTVVTVDVADDVPVLDAVVVIVDEPEDVAVDVALDVADVVAVMVPVDVAVVVMDDDCVEDGVVEMVLLRVLEPVVV